MESHGALQRPTSTLHQNLYYYQHSAATQQALVVVVVQMACKCVSAYLDERARAHAFFVTLAWLVAQRLLLNVRCVCVSLCEKGDVFCGLWVVNAIVFVCFKSSLTFTFYSFAGIFFSVLFASMWVNKTHCFGGFARWGGTHTQSGVSVRK